MMGRSPLSARLGPRTILGVLGLAVATGGVVAGCGRIGFDDVPSVDASLVDVVAVNPDVGTMPAPDTGMTGPLDAGEEPGDDAPEEAEAAVACSPTCSNAHGTTTCENGVCVPSCAPGFSDCDGNVANGCETNVQADPAHCGTCPNLCVVDSGSATCQSGVCGTSSCAAGTGDCDFDAGDGCETNLNTSTANCGFCGNACTFPHAAASCSGGGCQLGACAGGFANCDGTAGNGCEADLTTTAHCGSCGVACTNANGTTACTAGACKPSCSAGFGDCDGDLANGCETAVNTTSNCGTCGHVCTSDGGTPSCSGGTCGTTCDFGGTWATKLTMPLTWPASGVLTSGSGTLVVYALLTGTEGGSTVTAGLVPCSITVPDFASTLLSQTYGLTFPTSLFDHVPAFLPTTSTTFTLAGSSPGSTFTSPAFAFVLGTMLTNPTTDAWPAVGSIVSDDMDMDSNPGITVPYKTGGSYSLPLVDGTHQSDQAYLATRLALSTSGAFSDCSDGSGTVTVTHFDTHIIGCHVSGGAACTTTQSNTDDANRPPYAATTGTIAFVKIAPGSSCMTVRGAL
jgi:hypothetical protein